MKKIILPLLAILLLAAIIFFIVSNRQKQNTSPEAQTPTTAPTPATEVSLQELVASGKSQTCTYSYSDESVGKMEGTVYVSGGKMRGDYSIEGAEGKAMNGSMIYDGKYMYTWSSAMPQGMKIAVSDDMKQATSSSTNQQSIDMQKKMNYSCKSWTADTSKFTPPSDVTFREFAIPSLSPGQSAPGGEQTTNNCGACNSLPNEAKEACLTAMKCN